MSNLEETVKINWKSSCEEKNEIKKAEKYDLSDFSAELNKEAPYLIPSACVGLGLDYLGFIGQPEKIDGISLAIVAASSVMAGLFGRYSGALQFGFISYLIAKLAYEPIFTHKAGLDSFESVAATAFIPFLASLALKYVAKH